METPKGYSQINALFGNPANSDGSLNLAWEHANIHTVSPPNGWKLYYQNTATSIIPVSGIRMHKLLEGVFTNVMNDIWQYAKQQLTGTPSDEAIRKWLHDKRLDQTGGGFNFRKS
jgi:hypothetical protein